MWYYVDPHSGVPIYIQLKEQIRKAVASGLLKEGEQLPSVRELALRLTVNPNTVAKVYQELEREGIIETARGLGTFIKKTMQKSEAEQEAALDRILESLMVEAYQLSIDTETLKECFLQKLETWKKRLRKGDRG